MPPFGSARPSFVGVDSGSRRGVDLLILLGYNSRMLNKEPAMTTNLDQFYRYCLDFYGAGGIYDYSFTRDQVERATQRYRSRLAVGREFYGDTVDREAVRDIILDELVPA
jgi:hypothetical protein